MDWERLMEEALAGAREAAARGEVPVGAVVCGPDGEVLARAGNRTVTLSDPTAHAEILALREAARSIANYRLTGCSLVCTVEPCIMCMGAAVHARVARVVYGAPDPRWGAAGALYAFQEDTRLNHRPLVAGGVLEEACRDLIQGFFRDRRAQGA